MATSSKQIAANRNNARKSTGPQTTGGKARSRQNAVKHGLTGAGIALPTEDAAEVDRRFLGLHSEMGASSMLADLLVHRVALMSVRLDRSARQEAKALSEKIRRAGADFDEARAAEADHLLGWIGSEPVSHRRKLLRTPEGTDRLIAALLDLRSELDGEELFWDYNHMSKIEAYFGRRELDLPPSRGYVLSKAIGGDYKRLDPKEVAHCSTDNEKRNWAADELMLHIDAEVARLRAHRETLDHEAIALDRAEAGDRAMFDPSKDATLARRYERAAERGFYQALHEFRAVEASPRAEAEAEADEEILEAGDELIIPPVEEIAAIDPIDDHESKSPKSLPVNDLESEMGSFGNSDFGPKTDLGSPASTKPLGDLGRLSGGLVSLIMIWLSLFGSRVEAEGADSAMAKRLYVGNLVFSTTSADLRALFAEHGTVQTAQIQVDRESGKSRGFGFVLMANDDEAETAIARLDGSDFHDRRLNVNEAQAKMPPGRDDRRGPGRREGPEPRSGGRF